MSKGQVIEEAAILFERTLAASPEKAWAFLTEIARLTEWYGEGAIERREGGKVELMGGHIRGVVTGWRPREFLAYTWNVFSPGETVSGWPVTYLEFVLVPEGENTKLTLIHRSDRADLLCKRTPRSTASISTICRGKDDGQFRQTH
jgi:uncharacterized protein YndB with AHSA1/START domain